MDRAIVTMGILAGLGFAPAGCASTASDAPDDGGAPSLLGDASGFGGDGAAGSSVVLAVIRDFRFYNANDPSTDPDFENPPYDIDQNGNPAPGYQGPWDDRNIAADTLGPDGKPVYKNPGGTTLTTHGQASFDKWYHDVSGTNYHVEYPVPVTQRAAGVFGYDSASSGVPYGDGINQGNGFFPIDDGSMYQTPFGQQGKPHNYSFTVEIHTVFSYRGGEYFTFRGDDDVFVFINGKLVINLGGIHSPEMAQVNVDTLGLTMGDVYPLDFFSAERHVTGSNILFDTTLKLQPIPYSHPASGCLRRRAHCSQRA